MPTEKCCCLFWFCFTLRRCCFVGLSLPGGWPVLPFRLPLRFRDKTRDQNMLALLPKTFSTAVCKVCGQDPARGRCRTTNSFQGCLGVTACLFLSVAKSGTGHMVLQPHGFGLPRGFRELPRVSQRCFLSNLLLV